MKIPLEDLGYARGELECSAEQAIKNSNSYS